MAAETMDAWAVAARLQTAFETRDLFVLAEILDPDVRWGPDEETPQTCHSRADVLAWYGGLYARGFRADIVESAVEPGRILLRLDVQRPDGEVTRNNQLFTVRDGLIVDIRDGQPLGDDHPSGADRR